MGIQLVGFLAKISNFPAKNRNFFQCFKKKPAIFENSEILYAFTNECTKFQRNQRNFFSSSSSSSSSWPLTALVVVQVRGVQVGTTLYTCRVNHDEWWMMNDEWWMMKKKSFFDFAETWHTCRPKYIKFRNFRKSWKSGRFSE